MNVAIIPARGGSKRIPRKNIKMFCGKPMIAWSIEAAIESACFSRVIVSTDDDDIATVAKEAGAEVPFRRPADLADDHTGTIPVIAHAVDWLKARNVVPDFACCIYATAPFVTAASLKKGLSLIKSSQADYVFSATSFAFPIQRALKISKQGRVGMFYPEHFRTRSQDLEEAYHDAGQFYWGKTSAWLKGQEIFTSASTAIILPRYRVQDIDTPDDWTQAELIHQAIKYGYEAHS